MKSSDVDRLVVEFAKMIGADRVVVVGSQSIHAVHPDPPIDVVEASREVDVVPIPFEAYEKWFYYAHEQLGADSEFDEQNGVYVDMIRASVPKLPHNWEARAIERVLDIDNTRQVRVLYPDVYDLLISKLLANRPQDESFLQGVMRLQKIDRDTLEVRLRAVSLAPENEHLRIWAAQCIARALSAPGTHSGDVF